MTKPNLLILGYGMQGKAALYDCLQHGDFNNIVVADSMPDFPESLEDDLNQKVNGVRLDASNLVQTRELIRQSDIVIEALPACFTVPIGKIAAEEGVHIVSSMYYLNPGVEEPKALAALKEELAYIEQMARKNNCTILTEFGLDPGLDLIVGAHALKEVDEVDVFNSEQQLIKSYSRDASLNKWVQTFMVFLYPFHHEKRKKEELYVEFLHDIFEQIESEKILSQ